MNIGNIELSAPLALAPMAGITDLPLSGLRHDRVGDGERQGTAVQKRQDYRNAAH